MTTIEFFIGREVLDSRGNPTVEVEVVLESGAHGRAIVPSRRVDRSVRSGRAARRRRPLHGQGRAAARSTTSTARSPTRSKGSTRSSSARSTASCAISTAPTTRRGSAPTRSSARRWRSPRPPRTSSTFRSTATSAAPNAHVLPVPMMNVLNGGAHADNNVDLQEFMIMPVGAPSLPRGAAAGARRCYHTLKKVLHDRKLSTLIGDEGGFAPNLKSNEEAIQLLIEAIEKAGFTPGDDIALALDAASTEFFKDGAYHLDGEGKTLSSTQMVELLGGVVRQVPDRVDRRRHGRRRLGRLEGADAGARRRGCSSSATTCSSPTPSASARGITTGVANSILVKVNQIGTLTETLEAVDMAHRSRLHRGHVAPLGRERGHDHRRSRRGHQLRPDQDRRAGALRSRRQVQPVAAHRRRPRRGRRLPRAGAALAGGQAAADGKPSAPTSDAAEAHCRRPVVGAALGRRRRCSCSSCCSSVCSRRGSISISATRRAELGSSCASSKARTRSCRPSRSIAGHRPRRSSASPATSTACVRPGEENYVGAARPSRPARRAGGLAIRRLTSRPADASQRDSG